MKEIIDRFSKELMEVYEQTTLLSDFCKLPRKHHVYRMPFGFDRAYHTVDNGTPHMMSGISGLAKTIAGFKEASTALDEWKAKVGAEEAGDVMHDTSNMGTFMHILCAEVAIAYATGGGGVVFNSETRDMFLATMRGAGVREKELAAYWRRAVKGAQSFHSFLVQYDLDIQAVEFPVISFKSNLCTPIDFVAYATVGGERKLCGFNLKFREKAQTYISDGIQVCLEQQMFNQYMTEQLQHTFIVIPKSHPSARTECMVKDYTGFYTVEEMSRDLAFLKEQPRYKSMFFPNLDQNLTHVEDIIVGKEIISKNPQTIREFILSCHIQG